MKITNFVKKNNFHDCKISNLRFDSEKKTFEFDFYPSDFSDIKNECKFRFKNVASVICDKKLNEIDEYILNIWLAKGKNNVVQIILDDDNDTSIFIEANLVEIL